MRRNNSISPLLIRFIICLTFTNTTLSLPFFSTHPMNKLLLRSKSILLHSSFLPYRRQRQQNFLLFCPFQQRSDITTTSTTTFTTTQLSTQNHDTSFHNTTTTSSSLQKQQLMLPQNYPHLDSILPALSAIRKACRITQYLQPYSSSTSSSSSSSSSSKVVIKSDASPVTVADFSAQAIILQLLHQSFPLDILIAEESSDSLNETSSCNDLSSVIWNIIQEMNYTNILDSIDTLKQSIDLGQTYDYKSGAMTTIHDEMNMNRIWCLDPVDGTRGFLRGKIDGGQYCIALSLIQDGVPIIGILACPNLPSSSSSSSSSTHNYKWTREEIENYQPSYTQVTNTTTTSTPSTRGCIFIASKNGGCYELPLFPPHNDGNIADCKEKGVDQDSSTLGARKVQVTTGKGNTDSSSSSSNERNRPPSKARFCIGVENYSDPYGHIHKIAKHIHGTLDSDGNILYTQRMDSQVKYGVIARGDAEIFLRLPKKDYVEWIWDHAAGKVVIEEAGGIQTDTMGNGIDYGLGAKMDKSVNGILASCGGEFHQVLLDAYKTQVSST